MALQDTLIGKLIDSNYKEGSIVDWISGKELKDIAQDIKGLGFEAAFRDAKKFYSDAYGVAKSSQTGFTNYLLKVYYLSSLNKSIGMDIFSDLIEALQPKSETRKLIEILYSIITKDCNLMKIFNI